MDKTSTNNGGTSFADRLNLLFESVRPAGRDTPYSNRDVATAIRAAGGSISDVYIWQLRTGRRDNPTKDHIEALASFFGVSPAYFFDNQSARDTMADLKTLRALRDLRIENISLRTVLEHKGLSPASQEVIHQLVERCLELEGLAGERERNRDSTRDPKENQDPGEEQDQAGGPGRNNRPGHGRAGGGTP